MIYKNAQENVDGSIDCLILLGGEWEPNTQDPAMEYELSEELGPDDWPEIKSCPQSEKDAHELQIRRDEVLRQITGLDLPLHTVTRALSGDTVALDKVREAESQKQVLRKQLGELS